MGSYQTKDIIIVELNEFNDTLLQTAITQQELPALAKVLNMPRTQYRTEDRYNSGYLEPWVQWVSIHSATPSKLHRVKHLGDVPDLQFEQFWEVLSRHHVSCGVWGVMNGALNNAKNVPFFLPDPWTFSEEGYPKELNNLLKLPRHISKNYQDLNKMTLALDGLKLVGFLLKSGIFGSISKEIINLIKNINQYGHKHFVYIAFFEYLSFLLFSKYKSKYKPKCSLLFINTLAHLQHHYWTKGPTELTPEITFGLKMVDRLFAHLFKTFPNDGIVVHNGLSQMNTNHEKPWVLYRQKNPENFLKALNVPVKRVEAHMTHDAHLFFENNQDCEQAFEALKSATMLGKPLFHVEKNTQDSCKLFYHLVFTDVLDNNSKAEFEFKGKTYVFFEYFDSIVKRTGRHIPIGTVYSDTIKFRDQIYNHDFNRYLFNYLMPDEFTLTENSMELFDDIKVEVETDVEMA